MNSHVDLHPCIKYQPVLEQICRPLDNLGVVFFGYTAVDLGGLAYCLGSQAGYAAEYLKRNHASNDIHQFEAMSKSQLKYHFWDFVTLDDRAESLYQMAADFDQGHTLTVTRHEEEMTHCYHFSGKLIDWGINQRYIDKMDFIHGFIDYFDDCLENVEEVKAIYQHPVNLVRPEEISQRALALILDDPRQYELDAIAKNEFALKNAKRYFLTESERTVLYWLHHGKSADMIADILGVSRKTVERHIASMKTKYDCYTLFQLGEKIAAQGLDTLFKNTE